MYVGVTFLYVTVFLSNICMLVIYLCMLHNKHIYVIVDIEYKQDFLIEYELDMS